MCIYFFLQKDPFVLPSIVRSESPTRSELYFSQPPLVTSPLGIYNMLKSLIDQCAEYKKIIFQCAEYNSILQL